jgi:Zn-dependent protease with chaperone function/Zn-finger nucleic acid-binding protein
MFEIEREARWRVWALFALLLSMVFVCMSVCIWIVLLVTEAVVDQGNASSGSSGRFLSFSLSWRGLVLVVVASLAVALGYWFVSRIGARDHLIRAMHAQPLDPDDRFHQRLADIVEEMRLATGAPAIRCLTVPTVGLNAFAFSDLRGGACIGVTEGALSRLSRQQLEAVVAHEFGHVLSGDYITATSACLLFGVYTSLGDSLDDAAETGASARAEPLLLALIARGALGLLQLGSAVVNAGISRQGEWAADLAAARYTRDPLSLAQALQMMVRHPGGGGYIPDGLSALCIRPTDLNTGSAVARAMATHPPVNDRIVALLNIAHVSWETFQGQAATAEADFEQREHVTPAPGAAAERGAERLTQLLAAPLAAAAPVAATVVTAATAMNAAALAAGTPPAAAHAVAAPAAAASLQAHAAVEQAPACPVCRSLLERCDYEGTSVFVCRSCAGRLATTPQIQRILTRREMRFDDRQQRLADYVVEHGDELRRDFAKRRGVAQTTLIACPRCARTMMRRHYNYDQAVEIDYCGVCDLYWFDKDELEVLQAIVERQAQ